MVVGSAHLLGHHRPVLSPQRVHPAYGEGLGQAHAVAAGLTDVCVVEEPVDGGGGCDAIVETITTLPLQLRAGR